MMLNPIAAVSAGQPGTSVKPPAAGAVSAAEPLATSRLSPASDGPRPTPVKTDRLITPDSRFMLDWLKATFANEAPYAAVMKDGKVLASLDNGGGLTTSDGRAVAATGSDDGLTGPALAQLRADRIARALGGTVVLADTAKSDADWTPAMSMTPAERAASFNAYVARRLAEEGAAPRPGLTV